MRDQLSTLFKKQSRLLLFVSVDALLLLGEEHSSDKAHFRSLEDRPTIVIRSSFSFFSHRRDDNDDDNIDGLRQSEEVEEEG